MSRTALLVLDWQRFFVSPDSPAFIRTAPATEPNVRALVGAFLAARRPVLATRHAHLPGGVGPFERFYGRVILEDDPLSALAPWLGGRHGVRFIVKRTYSAFASTPLTTQLHSLGVKTLVIAGTQTDKCVVANALAVFDLGFNVIVASDACAARSEERHQEALRMLERSCAILLDSREICEGVKAAGQEAPRSAPRAFDADLLIAGAGPAGIAAFIQARREGLDPIVVEPSAPGGALRAARRVENYPGVPAIAGPALADRMARHAAGAGMTPVRERVVALAEETGWRVILSSGQSLRARAVVLATGQEAFVPEALGPLRATGALLVPGAFDPAEWRGRRVLVVGGGDVAYDQALLLYEHEAFPEIVCRSEPKALPSLREEAAQRGIPVRPGFTPVVCLAGPPVVLTFSGCGPGASMALDADGVLVAAGKRPSPPEVRGPGGERLDLISRAPGSPFLPGLFLAGDVRLGTLRQAVVAAGDGCAAALSARRYLCGTGTGGGA